MVPGSVLRRHDVFKAMLDPLHFKEGLQRIIDWSCYSEYFLRNIVKWLETGQLTLQCNDDLMDYFAFAHLYHMETLLNSCENMLIELVINGANFDVEDLAEGARHLNWSKRARECLDLHRLIETEEMLDVKNETMLLANREMVEIYLASYGLKCENEKQVLKALIGWCCHDKQKRFKHFLSMAFRCIRLESIEREDIQGILLELEEEEADGQLTLGEKLEIDGVLLHSQVSNQTPSGRLNLGVLDGLLAFIETDHSRQSGETPKAYSFVLKDNKGNLMKRIINIP